MVFLYIKGIKVVFSVNKLFLSLKILAFVLFIALVAPQIRAPILENKALGVEYVWFAIPILVTSFGFHIIIPAIRNYFENNVVFKKQLLLEH